MRQRLLITGPGGRVGTHIVPLLRKRFDLRLFDLNPVPATAADEFIQGDIRDLPALKQACQGVDALLHLAAISDEDDFQTRLLPMNVQGAQNAFEAARQAKVRKVVFTSTGQTMLGYGIDSKTSLDLAPRPSTLYACTKLFGEALGRYYSDHHNLSVICIRLCWFQGYDSPLFKTQPELLNHWCSPRDLTQLLEKAVESDLPFALVYGLSNNTNCQWDNTPARELLGYSPQDNAETYR